LEESVAPAVSVVVPCRNEKDHIETCVRSILAQELPPGGFEVIVADGISDDGTRDILKLLVEEDPRLRIVDNPGRITPCGMNAGIDEAKGPIHRNHGGPYRYMHLTTCGHVANFLKSTPKFVDQVFQS